MKDDDESYRSSPNTLLLVCVGTCSLCGGALVLNCKSPTPSPFCVECGATHAPEVTE